jgi:HEAT repeat protein
MVRILLVAMLGVLVCNSPCSADDADTFQGKTKAQWLAQLKDKDAGTRKEAATALGKAGPKLAGTVLPLINAITDKDRDVRVAAVTALASFPKEADRVVSAMIRSLKDQDVKVRVAAVATLGTIAPKAKSAVPALAGGLRNDDIRIRVLAAEVLAVLKADAAPAAPALVECLGQKAVAGMLDGKEFLLDPAASAHRALIAIGEPAIPALVRGLSYITKSGDNVSGKAGQILGGMVYLSTVDNGKMSPGIAAIIPALIRVNDKDGLRACGPAAVPALTAALKQPKSSVVAAEILAKHEVKGLPIVIEALTDKNPKVRVAAASGLARIERRAKLIVDDREAFKNSPLREWAEMVRDEAMPKLIRMLKDPDRDARMVSASALSELGAMNEKVVPELINLLKDKDVMLQKSAVFALARIKNEAAIKGLIEAFRLKDKSVRDTAANQFRWIGRDALPSLTRALDDNDPVVAALAKTAIGHIKGN